MFDWDHLSMVIILLLLVFLIMQIFRSVQTITQAIHLDESPYFTKAHVIAKWVDQSSDSHIYWTPTGIYRILR